MTTWHPSGYCTRPMLCTDHAASYERALRFGDASPSYADNGADEK